MRTQRRANERRRLKLERDLERLAKLQPGGAPDRPIPVGAPPQIDIITQRTRCPICQTTLRLEQHEASTIEGVPLRVARTFCAQCGTKRPLYFRLSPESLH